MCLPTGFEPALSFVVSPPKRDAVRLEREQKCKKKILLNLNLTETVIN